MAMKISKVSKDRLIGIGIALGVFFGGLLIIALIMNFIVMPLLVREGSETRVPDIVNLSMRAAEAKLQEAGLGTIKGNEEFDSERPKSAVIKAIQTLKGARFSQKIADEDIRRLFALRKFEDIEVLKEEVPEGIKVIFKLVESPIVEQIVFEGISVQPMC